MKRRGLLRTGQSFQWRWNFQGVPCGSMSVLTEADALVLMFRSLGPSGRELSFVRQRVAIAWTPRHLGGGRPWFICGAYCAGRSCGKRVAVLYSVGDLFACRNCCDIAYASQRESPKFRGRFIDEIYLSSGLLHLKFHGPTKYAKDEYSLKVICNDGTKVQEGRFTAKAGVTYRFPSFQVPADSIWRIELEGCIVYQAQVPSVSGLVVQ
jgi:hypothetical protein